MFMGTKEKGGVERVVLVKTLASGRAEVGS